MASALTKVQIARIGKTSHAVPPKQAPLRLAYITEHPIGSVRTVLRVVGDDNARCLNVSTLRQTLFYRSSWSVIHLKPPMMKRFFYPWNLLQCGYCPKLGKRFIKVDHMPQAASRRSKTHTVRRPKSTAYGTAIRVVWPVCRHLSNNRLRGATVHVRARLTRHVTCG